MSLQEGEGCYFPLPLTQECVQIGRYHYHLRADASPQLIRKTKAIADAARVMSPSSPPRDEIPAKNEALHGDEVRGKEEAKEDHAKEEDRFYGYAIFFLSTVAWSFFS